MPSPPEEPGSEIDAQVAGPGSDETREGKNPPEPLEAGAAPDVADQTGEPAGDDAEATDEKTATGPPDYKAVARISTQAVLQSIDLASLHAQLKDGVAVPREWAVSARRSEDASANFDRDALTLVVHCAFDTAWAPEPAGELAPDLTDEAPLQLHARFRIEYAINSLNGILDGDEEHFARTNGMLHAWPYWREAAQSMTVRMGVEPLVVGTFKIPWSGDPGREKKADRVAADQRHDSATDAATATPPTVEASASETQTPPSQR
ncbi:MAG TPA: hypothetical protein VGF95_15085 [Solirubrobacteraceae bacterium]|jgi:hypothetical protein